MTKKNTSKKVKQVTFTCDNKAKIDFDHNNAVCKKCASQAKYAEQHKECIDTIKAEQAEIALKESERKAAKQKSSETTAYMIKALKNDQKIDIAAFCKRFDHVSAKYAASLRNKLTGVHKACTHIDDNKIDTVYKRCVVALVSKDKAKIDATSKKYKFMMKTAKRFYREFIDVEEEKAA